MAARTGKSARSKTTVKPTTTRKKTATTRKRTPARKNKAKEIESIAQSSANIIRKAASILEEEVSAGVAAARQVENSLTGKQEFSAKDFGSTVSRFRKDAHDIVNLIGNSLKDSEKGTLASKKESDADKAGNFQTSAHEIVDLVMNLVDNAPDIVEKISKLDLFKTGSAAETPPRKSGGKATK